MVYLIRGAIPAEERNPINRVSMALYDRIFRVVIRHPVATLVVALALGLSAIYPASRLGSEFMPALEEGDLLYMPTTDPSISVTTSRTLLQQSDKLIKTFPEVASVHGKIGRADTATDPAPLSMIETVVRLHTDPARWRTRPVRYAFSGWPDWLKWPLTRSFWPERRRITMYELKFGWTDPDGTQHPGLNQVVSFPGVANAWPYPIENRLNMLATGIKTPVGIKISGPDLATLQRIGEQVEAVVRQVPGTLSVYAERVVGGNYVNFTIDRDEIARYALTVGDVQDVIASAIGGMNISSTVEGLERYTINLRYPRELRDNLDLLQAILVPTPMGQHIPLGQLARLDVDKGPPSIKSENSRPNTWVYVDLRGIDVGTYVAQAQQTVDDAIRKGKIVLPAGYNILWSGQYEYMLRAQRRLLVVVPITLLLIVIILYLNTRSLMKTMIVMLAVPFSLVGAIWLLWFLDYDMSIAVWVGIIALAGLDAETGVVMLLYLELAYEQWRREGKLTTLGHLREAIYHGAAKRLRPKLMTVSTTIAGLLPILWSAGAGADVMRRMAVPMIGGLVTSFTMELLVYPAIYFVWRGAHFREEEGTAVSDPGGERRA